MPNGTGSNGNMKFIWGMVTFVVFLTLQYFAGQTQAEQRAREIAQEEVSNVWTKSQASDIREDVAVIKFRIGEQSDALSRIENKLDDQ